jgi:hypothetical protein
MIFIDRYSGYSQDTLYPQVSVNVINLLLHVSNYGELICRN